MSDASLAMFPAQLMVDVAADALLVCAGMMAQVVVGGRELTTATAGDASAIESAFRHETGPAPSPTGPARICRPWQVPAGEFGARPA